MSSFIEKEEVCVHTPVLATQEAAAGDPVVTCHMGSGTGTLASPPQEQQVLLAAEPSLLPLLAFLIFTRPNTIIQQLPHPRMR